MAEYGKAKKYRGSPCRKFGHTLRYVNSTRACIQCAKDKARLNGWRYRGITGMTEVEYKTMLVKQRGLCAICQQPPKQIRLSVDHNHKTGATRGLLCVSCNRALGWYENYTKACHTYLEE